MSKKSVPESVSVTFDLHELPTAQHRAGLAGLILQIEAMGPKPNGYGRAVELIPKAEVSRTAATVTFTAASMQGLFEELYAAKLVQVIVANKWPGEDKSKPGEFFLEKKDPKTGELKSVSGFAYDVVQPQGLCLQRHLQGDGLAWLKLWREMLWAIPRGGNNVRSRAPFEQMARSGHCGEGSTAWTQLVEFQSLLQAKSQFKTQPISGALMLGAQAVNAEGVSFSGRVDHNLLLHFWQLVVLAFVPMVVDRKEKKTKSEGYVLAIPDVADLLEFRDLFPQILQGLRAENPQHTPAQARVDLPEQASLEVLRRLKAEADLARAEALNSRDPTTVAEAEIVLQQARRAEARVARGDRTSRSVHQSLAAGKAASMWDGCIQAVESFHLLKAGNNVKLLSFARVADRPRLVGDYERIVANYRNPLFRSALLRALIREQPWHGGMNELFAEYPWSFFVESDDTPKYLPRFGRDAREKFQASRKDTLDMSLDEMNQEERTKRLGDIIQRLVNKYVEGRAEVKTGKKARAFPKQTVNGRERRIYPNDFREAQQRVCSDAFLAMRSRHDQDFVEYFASSICSVAQYLPSEDFQLLTKILMTSPDPNPVVRQDLTRDDIKAIAMVAVSACSFQVRPRDTKSERSPA